MNKQTQFGIDASVEGDWHRLLFKGPITEEAKPTLMQLLTGPKGKVILDLADVTFINSCGVRDWSFFLKSFVDGREVVFERVTDDIVRTMNMVVNFHARLPVRSLFRTYHCESCERETRVLYEQGKHYQVGEIPTMEIPSCSHCSALTEPVEADDEYFQFLVA